LQTQFKTLELAVRFEECTRVKSCRRMDVYKNTYCIYKQATYV